MGFTESDLQKESKEQISTSENAIKEIESKEEAEHLEAERKAEEKRIADEKVAKKRKKIIAIVAPIVCVCIAFLIVLTTVITPKQKLNKAILESNIGDIVTFGSYEQDNNTSNGKEDIKWRVLAKEDDRILVISEYGLDCQPYNTLCKDNVTWENCSLRKWMNDTFLKNAFSAEEQARIQKAFVPAYKNPEYRTNPGEDTTDKVFLLSITDVEKYFSSDEDRKCVPTAYAIAHGAYTSDDTIGGEATCCWWLRSPGCVSYNASHLLTDGSVYCYGYIVDGDVYAVRPALWIEF